MLAPGEFGRCPRPLGPMTTFGIGGAAAAFVEPADEAELAQLLRALDGTSADVYEFDVSVWWTNAILMVDA